MMANRVRGEVEAVIGGQKLTIACTLEALAAFDALISEKYPKADGMPRSMGETLMMSANIPFGIVKDCVSVFAISGDVDAAVANFDVPDTLELQKAVTAVVMAKYQQKPGNADPAKESR